MDEAAINNPPSETEQVRSSRRAFLRKGTKRALYVAPVVLTLSAQKAVAASGMACGSAFKTTVGSPCATDGSQKDCCPPLVCSAATDGVCQNP